MASMGMEKMMNKNNLIIFCFSFTFLTTLVVGDRGGGGLTYHGRKRVGKLFVFGDSYADTGNMGKFIERPWSEPYGITFPGKPTGRFSDGRVFTDFVASYLNIRSPVPYKVRHTGKELLGYGMNFAVGGSGVFDTIDLQPNLTIQIDRFEDQLKEGVFSERDLRSSIAIIAISGNDYSTFQENGGTMDGLLQFIPRLVDQIKTDMKRVRNLGVRNIGITDLHPLGCTPDLTIIDSYRACNDSVNDMVDLHNAVLSAAVRELNEGFTDSKFLMLGVNQAFMSVINSKGEGKFKEVLKPCCAALDQQFSCSNTDFEGKKLYSLCSDRRSSFYWDSVHPTQAGWAAVAPQIRDVVLHLAKF
ncbi:GDSL esterase/lipase [Acorus gramineus]|uniref:GDSL esterase/lipase n=1 Tax=Acorus gramineus TaxID=55184 RepID=A0AAV9BII4_ACOGR|nr:GDSL esterase/lipase [Acorus gramineus]